MGRIKSTLVKRTSEKLLNEKSLSFDDSFENNKKILGMTMPSKKIRNKIAGYISRIVKIEKNAVIKQQKREAKKAVSLSQLASPEMPEYN